jgi:hypothetical protein
MVTMKTERTFPTEGSVATEDLVGREDALRGLFARTFRNGCRAKGSRTTTRSSTYRVRLTTSSNISPP